MVLLVDSDNSVHMNIDLDQFSRDMNPLLSCRVETTGLSKQPIRTRYLGHVTDYQPIRDQYSLIRSVHAPDLSYHEI